MNSKILTDKEILDVLKPETDLERFLAFHPDVRKGLGWGEPRYGHPEGMVLYHIPDIFENIDTLMPPLSKNEREQLRLVALLHDAFKYAEDKGSPRNWSKHHSMLARQFAGKFITDKTVLDIIELHDEAYYSWRLSALLFQPQKSADRFARLLDRVGDCLQLYYVFFKCDTRTGDKTQAPVKWFEKKDLEIEKVTFLDFF
jgi:HD domain